MKEYLVSLQCDLKLELTQKQLTQLMFILCEMKEGGSYQYQVKLCK